jgi:hypothetical protein
VLRRLDEAGKRLSHSSVSAYFFSRSDTVMRLQ